MSKITIAELLNKRREDYGDAKESFARVAKYWSIIAGVEITPQQVARMMIAFKDSRLHHNPTHKDTIDDIVGYATLLKELSE